MNLLPSYFFTYEKGINRYYFFKALIVFIASFYNNFKKGVKREAKLRKTIKRWPCNWTDMIGFG